MSTLDAGADPAASDEHGGTDRLIALSDGIFAIAMTLLVLNIEVPSGLGHAHFRQSLHQAWSQLGTYGLSFAIIGGMWRDHRRVFHLVRSADNRVVHLTLTILGAVALLPFPTALLSNYGLHEPLAVATYAANVTAINLLLLTLFRTVRRDERLRTHPIPDRVARGYIADFGGTALLAAISILIAFTVSPGAGLLTWLAEIPVSLTARRLQHPPNRPNHP